MLEWLENSQNTSDKAKRSVLYFDFFIEQKKLPYTELGHLLKSASDNDQVYTSLAT